MAERAATSRRNAELKTLLERRREELLREVQNKIRDARADSALERDVLDDGERSDVDYQSALGFALIQMTSETLDRVDFALRRLQEDAYGNCVECLEPIHESRLRALPFAVRCTSCEGAREAAEWRDRSTANPGDSMLLLRNRTY
jgi:DnaK suppressor protein